MGRGAVGTAWAILAMGGLGCGAAAPRLEGGASSSLGTTTLYGVVDLGVLAGDVESRAADINNNGEVVGWSSDATGRSRAFVWRPAVGLAELGAPAGALATRAARINSSGTVVGTASLGAGSRAVQWDAGAAAFVPPLPDFEECEGTAISNSGQAVGWCRRGASTGAFLWAKGRLEPLAHLSGDTDSWAWAVNSRGLAVGRSAGGTAAPACVSWMGRVATDLGIPGLVPAAISETDFIVGAVTSTAAPQAVLYEQGRVTPLGLAGDAGGSFALAVNNARKVVGWFGDGTRMRAFVWSEGTRYDLNNLIEPDSGWELMAATGISETGMIVGYGRILGRVHGFVLNVHETTVLPSGDYGDAVEL